MGAGKAVVIGIGIVAVLGITLIFAVPNAGSILKTAGTSIIDDIPETKTSSPIINEVQTERRIWTEAFDSDTIVLQPSGTKIITFKIKSADYVNLIGTASVSSKGSVKFENHRADGSCPLIGGCWGEFVWGAGSFNGNDKAPDNNSIHLRLLNDSEQQLIIKNQNSQNPVTVTYELELEYVRTVTT